MVTIRNVLRSGLPFFLVTAFLPATLFMKAGFISVTVLWFFALCMINSRFPVVPQLRRHYLLLLPILFYILYCVGLLYSEDVSEAIKITIRKVHLLLIPLGFVLVNKKFTDKEFHTALLIFLFSCIATSLWCYANAVINIIQNKTIYYPGVYKLYYFSYLPLAEPSGITPIYLSMYANMAFVIAWNNPLINSRLVRRGLALYIAVFIILVAAKIGIISLVVIVSLLAFREKTNKAIIYISLVTLVAAFALAIYKFPFLKERFVTATTFDYSEDDGTVWNSTTLRLAIWSSAVEAVNDAPFFGYGPGDAQRALEHAYVRKGFAWGVYYRQMPTMNQYNPHNEFFSVLLEVGIPGVVILILMLITSGRYAFLTRNYIIIGFLVIILFAFTVESVLFRQKGIVFFTFFYSFLLWHFRNRQ